MSQQTERARHIRQKTTKVESLLWQALRAKRFCGLKFRRQHPVGSFFADFACTTEAFIIEVDGGYHEDTEKEDHARQRYLEQHGWRVFRFANDEVLDDVHAVAISLVRQLGLELTIRGKVAEEARQGAALSLTLSPEGRGDFYALV
jgi:very-short-patch-repair endonuclease